MNPLPFQQTGTPNKKERQLGQSENLKGKEIGIGWGAAGDISARESGAQRASNTPLGTRKTAHGSGAQQASNTGVGFTRCKP